ncbi:MAG: dienelactone hydrolase family protein [Nocardioides sp.]|nr:dienelactone hydrolase family protein [Nocardioides sp.]
MGQTIEIQAPGGVAEAYLTRPDDAPHPGVLLFMDAIGLRPRIEEMADRIASWGYVVLAPNVFYRAGRAAELAPTSDLRVPENREAFIQGAMKRVGGLTPGLSNSDAGVWVDTLLEHAEAPIGVVGYCMGARLAVRAASLRPDVVAACGGFHGGGLVTDDPESPHRKLAKARAEFVFGHADNDRSMPPEAVTALGEALAEAGLAHTNEVYAGAAHGYSMADSSTYDAAATERHFVALQGLLERAL